MPHPRYGQAVGLLLSLSMPVWGLLPAAAHAQIGIGVSITLAPPVIPVYAQPEIPGPGYLWAPGYWAWGDDDYYWVPGTWVLAPQAGYLWTPGYWGWGDGVYLWHGGYWGEHIGFYGGVNYGYGYGGSGYQGGYWQRDHFFYNSSVNNIRGNTQITNVYEKTVINEAPSRASYNGGQGGTSAQPSASERAAASEPHLPPVQAQVQHDQVAHATPALRSAVNHGQPPIAATAHAGVLSGAGVVATTPRALSARPAQVTARPSLSEHTTSPRETPVQHAPVQHASALAPYEAPVQHVPVQHASTVAPLEAPVQHASVQPASPPAPRPAAERVAARPPAAAAPAAPHAAEPRPSAPRPPPAQHPEQGGEHEHDR